MDYTIIFDHSTSLSFLHASRMFGSLFLKQNEISISILKVWIIN